MKFSIKDFVSKYDQTAENCDLVTFTAEILKVACVVDIKLFFYGLILL